MRRAFTIAAALLALATCAPPALAQTIMYPAWSAPVGGPLLFTPDDTYNIGAAGANRPHSAFLGGDLTVGTARFMGWSGRSVLTSPADGQEKCTNGAATAVCSIIGTATNDNAAAGAIGEYICAQVTNGGSPAGCATNTSTLISLTNNTVANVTSLSLTAGDWEVCFNLDYVPAGTTTTTLLAGSVSTTTAAEPSAPGVGAYFISQLSFATGSLQLLPGGCQRLSLSSTTTVFLTARAAFGVSTAQAGGFIWARRTR